MKNVNVNEMVELSVDDVISRSGYDISEWFEVFESGVYKVNYGSRGEIEEVSKVEVKDGVFEVESEEEFKKRMLDGYELYKDGVVINEKEIEEYREELDEWVYIEMVEGVVRMVESEENGYDIVKLVID